MLRTIAARLLLLAAMVWTAATVNFVMPRLSDRDPIAERLTQIASQGGGSLSGINDMVASYQARFGLDQSLWTQYVDYLGSILHFDLGYSIANYPTRVADQIAYALPWTIGLLGTATLIAFVFGTLLGALAAWPRAPALLPRRAAVVHGALGNPVLSRGAGAGLRAGVPPRLVPERRRP